MLDFKTTSGALAFLLAFAFQTPAEVSFWETVRNSGDPEMLGLYLSTYPDGSLVELADLIIGNIQDQNASTISDAVEQCDKLAGNEEDDTLPSAGVSFNELKENSNAAI